MLIFYSVLRRITFYADSSFYMIYGKSSDFLLTLITDSDSHIAFSCVLSLVFEYSWQIRWLHFLSGCRSWTLSTRLKFNFRINVGVDSTTISASKFFSCKKDNGDLVASHNIRKANHHVLPQSTRLETQPFLDSPSQSLIPRYSEALEC